MAEETETVESTETTEEQFDAGRAKALIAKLRDEVKTAKASGKEAETLRTRLADIERAQMSETDRAKAEAKERGEKLTSAETALRQERVERQIERVARTLNIVDEDAAVRLLDHSKIDYDTDGKPTNVKALLEDLAKSKPYLVGQQQQQQSNGSATNPARPANGTGTFTESQIRDRAFYEANKDAIMAAYNDGRIIKG
jgi:hypothetical protein